MESEGRRMGNIVCGMGSGVWQRKTGVGQWV